MSSDYMLPFQEIFEDSISNFTARVHSWVLPDNHALIQLNGTFCNNFTLSNFIERLSSYQLCNGISLPDTRKKFNFLKYVLPKVFNHFDLKPAVFQDEYFRTKNCSLLLLSTKDTCKICDKENIKFKTKVNSKKVF